MKEFIEIPFGTKDSELGGWEYTIPEGYTASVENGKIIVKKEESGDEKIRKELIEYIKDQQSTFISAPDCRDKYEEEENNRYNSWIAWLEKQGKPFTKKDVDDAYLKGIFDAKSELEKQCEQKETLCDKCKKEQTSHSCQDITEFGRCAIEHEQKPSDKVEQKFKIKYAGSEYNVLEVRDIAGVTFYGIEDEPNHIDYVKAENCEIISGYAIKENGSPYPTKPAVFSEQKSAWSEEDEDVINHLHAICAVAKSYTQFAGCLREDITKYQNWLILLKERYAWKPSDEQIQALEYQVHSTYEGSWQYRASKELLEQLKKL